jgi:hypothetical protein
VARSMGMCNYIWSLKYSLEFRSKMVHNFEIVVAPRAKGNSEIFVACFCLRSEGPSRLRALD